NDHGCGLDYSFFSQRFNCNASLAASISACFLLRSFPWPSTIPSQTACTTNVFRVPVLFVKVVRKPGCDGIDQILLAFAVHDGEPARITRRAPVPAQNSVATAWNVPPQNSAGIDRQQIRRATRAFRARLCL